MLLEFIFLFILGLIFGSFVSAVSYRIPRGVSFTKGRSFCPKCKQQISWYDNIPLFSYLILGGRCRNCKKHISLRYPIIEIATALGFLILGYLMQGLSLQMSSAIYLIYILLVFLLLLTIFVIDLEHQVIPDSLVFSGVFMVFLFLLTTNYYPLFPSLLSGFLAAAFLMFIHLITRGRGMGLGDVKFSVFAGMIVGLKLLPIWLFSAFLTGGIVGTILMITGKAKMKTKIAFGPFLIIGIVIALVFSENIISLINLI